MMFATTKFYVGLAALLALGACGGSEPPLAVPMTPTTTAVGSEQADGVNDATTPTAEADVASTDDVPSPTALHGLNPLALYDFAVVRNSPYDPADSSVISENCDVDQPGDSSLYTTENCVQMMLSFDEAITPSPDSEQWMEIMSTRFDRAYSYVPFNNFAQLAMHACDDPAFSFGDSQWMNKSVYAEYNSIRTLGECAFITDEDRAATDALELVAVDTVDVKFCKYLFRDQPDLGFNDSTTFDELLPLIDQGIEELDALQLSSPEAREVEEMKEKEILFRSYLIETESTIGELNEIRDELALEVGSLHVFDVLDRLRTIYTPVCVEARNQGRLD